MKLWLNVSLFARTIIVWKVATTSLEADIPRQNEHVGSHFYWLNEHFLHSANCSQFSVVVTQSPTKWTHNLLALAFKFGESLPIIAKTTLGEAAWASQQDQRWNCCQRFQQIHRTGRNKDVGTRNRVASLAKNLLKTIHVAWGGVSGEKLTKICNLSMGTFCLLYNLNFFFAFLTICGRCHQYFFRFT